MALSKERLLKVYRDMVMIRRFEEVIEEYAANGTIPGFVHLSIGQEACQAGVVDALKKTDYKFPDHRGHGAIALCGTDPKLVMAEIFAKETGINHGRGGSMHVNDLECRNMGFNGIQGSTMVTCLGTAFASVYNGTDDVTAVFLGDGTLGEGTCHESMNMAANIIVSFVCALQVNAFRKIKGSPYATTMCIGNLRSATENLYWYRHTGKQDHRDKFIRYYGVIGIFAMGAVMGSVLTAHLRERTIWVSCGLLLVSFLIMFVKEDIEGEEMETYGK